MGVDARLAIKDNDAVRQVGGHDEIVLDDEGGLLRVHDEALDDTRGDDTLLRIEVGGRLINDIDVGRHAESEDDGDTLKFTTGQVLDLLVDKVLQLERLDDVGLELGREESLLDLLEEELADGALELGGNGLGLHADPHLGHSLLAIGLEGTGEQAAEGGLSGTVLTHHDNDLGVGEVARVNAEVKVAELLLHLGVVEGTGPVDGIFIGGLGNTEGEGLLAETQILRRNVTVEEDVDTFTDRVGQGDHTVHGGLTVEDANVVGEIVEDGQIVLDDNDVVIITEQRPDDASSAQTLLNIKVGRRLIEHVDIGLLDADGANGESLKLTTREQVDVTVHKMVQLQSLDHLLGVAQCGTAPEQVANALLRAANSLGDLIDILGLDNSLEVVLEKLGKVV